MIDIDERRPWRATKILLVIGPGGAGKTALGAELAPLLDRRLVDLDQEFLRRIGNIDTFIRDEGYASYKRRNPASLPTKAPHPRCWSLPRDS